MPPCSAGEVLPGLWVGNLMSVSRIGDLVVDSFAANKWAPENHKGEGSADDISHGEDQPPLESRALLGNAEVEVTVISVLSDRRLIRLASDQIENQRLHHTKKNADEDISRKNSMECNRVPFHFHLFHHAIISLKDTVESDLSSVLPSALQSIDEALGHGSTASMGRSNRNSKRRICLVHCAKGASRSVSVVIAYLLSRHSDRFKTFDEALNHVRRVRPQAMPNMGFALALRRFERELQHRA
ncbi:hypothetical protein ACHAWF_010115 [Thalassiosira exigua]